MNKYIFITGFFLFSLVSHLHAYDNFIVHVIPKCGTHFIHKAIPLLIGKELKLRVLSKKGFADAQSSGTIMRTLDPFDRDLEKFVKKEGYKVISMIRDPRDALVSLVMYMRLMKGRGNQRDFFRVCDGFDDLSFDEQLLSVMTNPEYNYIDFYRERIKWYFSSLSYRLKYENLVGSQGGGDDLRQLHEVLNIAEYINRPISLEEAQEIASSLYVSSGQEEVEGKIFTHAQIGSWKTFFNEKHKKIMKKKMGKFLIALRYERDLDW